MSSFTSLRTIEPGDTIVVPPKQEEKIRVLPPIRDGGRTAGAALLSFAAPALRGAGRPVRAPPPGRGGRGAEVGGARVGVDLVDVADFRSRFEGREDGLAGEVGR